MNHPPHSPDLASSDFHLFDPLKGQLEGQKFYMDDELKQCPKLLTYAASFYAAGISALVAAKMCHVE
jgi:hypothetical protein